MKTDIANSKAKEINEKRFRYALVTGNPEDGFSVPESYVYKELPTKELFRFAPNLTLLVQDCEAPCDRLVLQLDSLKTHKEFPEGFTVECPLKDLPPNHSEYPFKVELKGTVTGYHLTWEDGWEKKVLEENP